MTKELDLIKTSNFNVDFTPAKIEIKNAEKINEMIEQVADNYSKTVYAEDDLDGLVQSHRELNKLRNGLDESRKKVKREFNKPLNEFEKEIKKMIKKVDEPLNEIKDQRDEILKAQEELRAEALDDYLGKQLKDTGLVREDIDILDSWTNKGVWTEKMNPRKTLKDEIKREINLGIERNKKLIAERGLLEQFFNSRDMDPSGWIAQLEDKSATEIIEGYQRQVEVDKKLREEENLTLEDRKDILEESDEESDEELTLDDLGLMDEEITNMIEVTGTVDQLSKLNQYLVTSGIKVRQIG